MCPFAPAGIAPSGGAASIGARWAALLSFAAGALGCTEEIRIGQNFVGGTGGVGAASSAAGAAGVRFELDGGATTSGGSGTSGSAASADAGPCVQTACGPSIQLCGNCQDDDGDGRVDAADPECLGPCDNSELELFTGTSARVTGSCRTDCYFDRNSGSGDDGCGWSFACDPRSVAPSYSPTGLEACAFEPDDPRCELTPAEQSACRAGCLPLTPNGCDCFGCCELPAHSGAFIWLGSEDIADAHCELSTSADPALCKPCTPVPDCVNDCAECELCIGKSVLPSSCNDADGVARPSCPDGFRSCDPARPSDCSPVEYCLTGCCVSLPT